MSREDLSFLYHAGQNSFCKMFFGSQTMPARKFLEWEKTALPAARASAGVALARAFLYGGLAACEADEVRLVLTELLDDPSPLVRRALAETLASDAHVPHYMVLTLAGDSSDIAAIVLARSPLFSEAELIDFAATADAFVQSAIALRPFVSAPVAAALAETGACAALRALAINPGAELLDFSIRRMIERHGHDAGLRAALLARPNLSAALRSDLAGGAAKALAMRLTGAAGLTPEKAERLTRDAREKANLQLAAECACEANGAVTFVAHLRRTGQLTAGLLLRGLLCGNKRLLEAALALTGVPIARVAALTSKSKSSKFAALYRKAGMPERLLPAFVAGLEAVAIARFRGLVTACMQGSLVAGVLGACISINCGELDQLIASLRRLEAEAARDEARNFRRAISPAPQRFDVPRRLAATSIRQAPGKPGNAAKPASFTIDLAAFEAALAAA
jgi:uncharacterized protein (DUF2336 family)